MTHDNHDGGSANSKLTTARNELAREIFIMLLERGSYSSKQAAQQCFYAADAFFDIYKIRNEIV